MVLNPAYAANYSLSLVRGLPPADNSSNSSATQVKRLATNMAALREDPEQWLDDHGEALYAFAMTRVHNTAHAEDLVQETLLAGFENLAKYKGGSTIRTWLISIMKNKIVDRIRKGHRESPLDLDQIDEQDWQAKFDSSNHWRVAPNDWGDPAKLTENTALGTALMSCIGKLPEQLRTLIVMRDIDGYETDELIDILNISSASNLWVMLSRSREKLRTCMEKNWFEGSPQ